MAQSNQNDISDIQLKNPSAATTIIALPIRGEKSIIPSPVSPAGSQAKVAAGFDSTGVSVPSSINTTKATGFNLNAARSTLIDYVMIRIPNRGVSADGSTSDPT